MEPQSPFRGQVFTVSSITLAIKQMMEGVFRGVFVEGEISGLREPQSGHLYFDLKDRDSLLSAVMFKWHARKAGQLLQDGLQVRVFGDLTCYGKMGRYQISVISVEVLHQGNLFLEFEKLKKKLEAEGLFSAEHKRPIPSFPRRIGVVTSATGAAIRDILSVLHRRSPNLEVVLAPALVQGQGAAAEIVQAIALLNKLKPAPDVLLVGRGGGSMEDLWAFNEEPVARAIFNSKIPVISCVGHEIDYTIADFVADLRAPTPSAAAELVVQHADAVRTHVGQLQKRLFQAVSLFYERAKNRVEMAVSCRFFKHPELLTQDKEQQLDDLMLRLENAFEKHLSAAQNRTELLSQKLNTLSPFAVLRRGYSITRDQDGQIISQVGQTKPTDTIYVQVKDGMIHAEVK